MKDKNVDILYMVLAIVLLLTPIIIGVLLDMNEKNKFIPEITNCYDSKNSIIDGQICYTQYQDSYLVLGIFIGVGMSVALILNLKKARK